MAANSICADTLIVSDIHAGWRYSRSTDCAALIRRFSGKRIIVNGDAFHHRWTRRIRKKHRALVESIYSALSQGVEVVITLGNHDPPIKTLRKIFPGANVEREYRWQSGSVRCLALHGHQFNRHNGFIWRLGDILKEIPDSLYHFIQRHEFRSHRLSRWLRKTIERLLGLNIAMSKAAYEYATRDNSAIDAVFCGHSHWAEEIRIGNIRFLNSGCWVGHDDGLLTYITIDENGSIEIRRYAD